MSIRDITHKLFEWYFDRHGCFPWKHNWSCELRESDYFDYYAYKMCKECHRVKKRHLSNGVSNSTMKALKRRIKNEKTDDMEEE